MTRPAPWKRSTRRERFARRQEFKEITEAYRAEQRPINRVKAARHRALQKLKRVEVGDLTVRPLTVIELKALGRPADEVEAAERRIVREQEARENQARIAGLDPAAAAAELDRIARATAVYREFS